MEQFQNNTMPFFIGDISCGQENVKISFLNETSLNEPPKLVSYTSTCVLTSESLSEDFESISPSCQCIDMCGRNCPCSASQVFVDGKLQQSHKDLSCKPIIECSDLCSCKENCSNRLVQSGIRFSLEIFQTHNKGLGVRTKEYIPKDSFVCEYAGEIIDDSEAQCRVSKQATDASNYIYVLKEHSFENQCLRTIIDPTYLGNVGRFLNHSCAPNLISVPIRANSMIPRICFFAKEDILPLQELSYNYGGECVSMDVQNDALCEDFMNRNARKCLCEDLSCCGFLPFVIDDWIHNIKK